MVHRHDSGECLTFCWFQVKPSWWTSRLLWPLRKCFHRWETAKPRNVREFWQMVTENIYNLFPPKTTSPANFDRCESEAVMVTSPCPGELPLDWVITVTVLPGQAESPLPISKHTKFVNCFSCDPDIGCLGVIAIILQLLNLILDIFAIFFSIFFCLVVFLSGWILRQSGWLGLEETGTRVLVGGNAMLQQRSEHTHSPK